MNRNTQRGFTLVELMVVIGILGLLVGVLAVAVVPRLGQAQKELEIKNMSDLYSAMQETQTTTSNKRKLNQIKDTKGREFYEQAFKRGLFRADLLGKIVSKGGPDFQADSEVVDDPEEELPVESCSFTAPVAGDLQRLLGARGKAKKVVVTFNSRNWNNYDSEVLVQWSDATIAVYMTAVEAVNDYDLDSTAWESNPKDIIGQEAPFDETFE